MMSILRLLPTCLCACLLAACGLPSGSDEAALEAQAFAAGSDGFHSQGTQLHGTPISSVAYANALVKFEGVHRNATLRLVKGELAADMPLQVSGTTPSLTPCFGFHHSGAGRSCGFTVEGQGVCTPGATVTLTSGACGLERGSCTGNPVMRVCSGERPCEWRGAGYLTHGDDATACVSSCPSATFTCPSSGIFTVLAGAFTPGQPWSLSLVASGGRFPMTTRVLRGRELVGARLRNHNAATTSISLEVVDAVNADSVTGTEGTWDESGDTFLYRVRVGGSPTTPPVELCAQSAGSAGWAWAVPVRGVFNALGERQDSTTGFTLGCDAGVIAKCYRWGYKPWMDGSQSGAVTAAHHACTRMARADYCGNGTSFTQNGTRIRLWDILQPTINAAPSTAASGMGFEAGWNGSGPACLSHWRWKHLTAQHCVELNEPIYDDDGHIVNDCRDPSSPYGPAAGGKCSQICDSDEEAKKYYGAAVFNESATNVASP
ncbi:ADYC domain-containing protein [Pyxidicoccus sp. 3LG]